jgi:MFS family permease
MRNSKSVLVVCLLLSFASGASICALATSLLAIQRGFSTSNEVLGRILLLFFVGGAFVVVVGGWLTEKFGEKKAALTALASLAIGSIMMARASSVTWVFVSAPILGFGCIWATVSYSVIVARHYPGKRQSMFSLISLSESTSAILQPLAFGAWFSRVEHGAAHSWLAIFFGLAAVPVIGFVVISLVWRPDPEASVDGEANQTNATSKVSARSMIFSGAMFLVGMFFLLHGIYQIGYVSWIGPYEANRIGITPAQAAAFISANNIGFFPARALLGWLCARVAIPDLVLLGVASGMGTLMIVLVLMTRNYQLALALCFLEGFFAAGDGPAISSFVGGRFLQRAGLAYSISAGFGQVGAATGGYVVGFLGQHWGNIQHAAWIIPVFSFCLSLLAFTGYFFDRRSSRRTQ